MLAAALSEYLGMGGIVDLGMGSYLQNSCILAYYCISQDEVYTSVHHLMLTKLMTIPVGQLMLTPVFKSIHH